MFVAFTLAVAMVLFTVQPVLAHGDHDHHHDHGHEHEVPEGWTLIDGGALLSPADWLPNSMPLELAIAFFTSGSPPVRWAASVPVVPVCTRQANRPAWVTADEFRQSVNQAAGHWNSAGARVGISYMGDCAGSGSWSTDNGINEIGWDDFRNQVRAPAVAVTIGQWTIAPGQRSFKETDVIFGTSTALPAGCFNHTMTHELGHVLGLGHSDVVGDVMFPSFNSNDPSTCLGTPSASERAFLQGLYGVNNPPVISGNLQRTANTGATTTISLSTADPDGGALTHQWRQTAGPSVNFTSSNAVLSFVAPSTPTSLAFQLVVEDLYLAPASATVQVSVVTPAARPGPPSFDDFGANVTASQMELRWGSSSGATHYRLCSTPTGGTQTTCATQDSATVQMTWPTVVGAASPGEALRVFNSGTRLTAMEACNSTGCSTPGVGPHAGGLRWLAHEASYDFFALAFDLPGMRFTIIGVVNLEGPARRFQMFTGTVDDPRARRIMSCGNVAAGGLCVGFIDPSSRFHTPLATIVSDRTGTPTMEHRIRIR